MVAEAQGAAYPTVVLCVALEVASKRWKAAIGDAPARRPRMATLAPYDAVALRLELGRARKKFGLADGCPVLICMEAGRDGFAPHRWLAQMGIPSIVIDPASVEVSRQKRRAKTDRLDAQVLLARLIRHAAGEAHVGAAARSPTRPRRLRRWRR